ncbi:DUF1330 domain-containing protein [Mycobacterium sp. 1554424.7]|nr:DUF1330 domain-containing protein [Mycobacterium sp. 1554424.7]
MSLEPTAEQFAALAARPKDVPVVMVNLLQFKSPGGLERYGQYAQQVAGHLERVGAEILFGGTTPGVVIGDGRRPWWEAIVIVRYPSPAAFIAMVTNEEYAALHEHRAAALDRGDLIATSIVSLPEGQ